MVKQNGEILHLYEFLLHKQQNNTATLPFSISFWIPRTNTNPFSSSGDEFRPHTCSWGTEHPVAAEINGRGLFLPSFSQMKSLWNIVTWKDVMHCLVLRNVLSWAEIHHTAPSTAAAEGNLAFSVFSSRWEWSHQPNSAEFHCYTNLSIAILQHPKYPIHCQSRRARTATTGGSPGWCLLKLQQKSLAGWAQAVRSEEQCKVSVMKCTSTGSPHSSGARSL